MMSSAPCATASGCSAPDCSPTSRRTVAWASSGGSRTFPEWVVRRAGASVGAARREVALGRALTEDLPDTRAAAGAGRISLEHAQVLTQLAPTSDVRRAVLASDCTDRNEESLVGAATRMGVDDYRR